MYKNKSFLAIIPARSGSKELPHKNIRPFAGKPLMAWTIHAALEAGVFDEVFVSTDSVRYASIAKEYFASVPFLRPAELSGDACPASGYILHAIDEYRNRFNRTFDYFVLLQPTTPLRTSGQIYEGVKMAVDDGLASVVSFSPLETDPRLIGPLPEDLSLAAFSSNAAPANTSDGLVRDAFTPLDLSPNTPNDTLRQDAERLYRLNGMLYICMCDLYEKTGSFYNPGGKAYIIGSEFSIDIDSETDFFVAEFLLNRRMSNGRLQIDRSETG